MKNIRAAIDFFLNKRNSGDAWKRVLLCAPERACARIVCSMYYTFHKSNLTKEELDEYHRGRDWVESVLSKNDLKYLIMVMPESKKPYYAGLLIEKEESLEELS